MARKKDTSSQKRSSTTRTKSRKQTPASAPSHLKLEIWGIILMGFAILLGGGLLSLQLQNENLMGPFGQLMGLALYLIFGLGGYLVVVALFSMALGMMTHRFDPRSIRHWLGYLLATLFGTIILYLLLPSYRLEGISAGGRTGELVGSMLVALFSKPGTYVISIVGMLVSLILATQESMIQGIRNMLSWTREAFAFVWNILAAIGNWLIGLFAWEEAPEPEEDSTDTSDGADDGEDENQDVSAAVPQAESSGEKRGISPKDGDGKPEPEDESESAGSTSSATPDRQDVPATTDTDADYSEQHEAVPEPIGDDSGSSEPTRAADSMPSSASDKKQNRSSENYSRQSKNTTGSIQIVEEKYEPKTVDESHYHNAQPHEFALPPLSLLQDKPSENYEMDRQAMIEKAKILVRSLNAYKIEGRVQAIHPGPVVTQYEFVPKEGTRLSRITALAGEIAMALEARKVRIVAPIPGKNAVGIEIPNDRREVVYLKELLMDEKFAKAQSPITVALGKDIKGRTVVMDLAKAPHALVAGTTGSGKSVALNTMLMSILYRATPRDVRLIIVDPKQVEFSPYEGLPHLLLPVVTDPDKANSALQWAVREMEERYEKLRALGVREITQYNAKLDRLTEQGETPVDAKGNPLERLPYLVILIDEFADLIQTTGKDVELAVSRLGQKARAAGINLILATQRPSADILTGIIRSNITTRLAFLVANKTDSRVILDQGGAESLLGHGDMLFMDRGLEPVRVHGAFVSTAEVTKVCDFLKEQGEPDYNLDILNFAASQDSSSAMDADSFDSRFDEAVMIVTSEGRASVSFLQRKMGIGYGRAAKIIDQMEAAGIISPPRGPKKEREILAPPPR